MSRSPVFELIRDLYVINTWFKFEGKIQNDSKLSHSQGITHDDDDADEDRTKNNMSLAVWGQRHNCKQYCRQVEHVLPCQQYSWKVNGCISHNFRKFAGKFAHVDGSATQLPVLLLALLLDMEAPLKKLYCTTKRSLIKIYL